MRGRVWPTSGRYRVTRIVISTSWRGHADGNPGRAWKQTIYAKAGVPEYWVVNVEEGTVEVYTEPTPTGFARTQTLRDGDVLRPTRILGIEIALADMPKSSAH